MCFVGFYDRGSCGNGGMGGWSLIIASWLHMLGFNGGGERGKCLRLWF